jgi:hypothetical protein
MGVKFFSSERHCFPPNGGLSASFYFGDFAAHAALNAELAG